MDSTDDAARDRRAASGGTADAAGSTDGRAPLLEIRGISKRYGSIQALQDVALALHAGEVHALVGENGAGKSTLIKIMTGVVQPDAGTLFMDGRPVRIGSALDGQRLGIAAIYQEPMIFPDLSVAENIFVGHRDLGRIINRRRMREQAQAVLGRLGIKLDVNEPARGLTLAEQQTVEIAKALSQSLRVLIMDEPTASLSAREVRLLFAIVESLRREGVAILFISHRIEEVFQISDRVTIMRDGRWISTRPTAKVTPTMAIRDMVGRPLEQLFARTPSAPGDVLLEVRDLGREDTFSGISFQLRAGEVLAFSGLVGARRTDVGLALFGIAPADSGEILMDGCPVRIKNPQDALRAGIAYTTEDRRQLGIVFPLSIAANISLPTLRRYLNAIGLVSRDREDAVAEVYRQRLKIRAPSVATPMWTLSGGNQQKVVLSKWMNTRPRVLILDEPTRGIDVGSKAEVHQIIDELAREGLGIILISSELPEVLAAGDRVLVMREGRQMGIFDRSEASEEVLLAAAMGQGPAPAGVLTP